MIADRDYEALEAVTMSKRILLIQNDDAAATGLLKGLAHSSDASLQVAWVRRRSEGLERLEGIEAILVDLCLPDSLGIETFDRLFRAAPNIPMLVLMGPQDEQTAKRAVQRGAQDYRFRARLDSDLLPRAVGSMIERATYPRRSLRKRSARRSHSIRSGMPS